MANHRGATTYPDPVVRRGDDRGDDGRGNSKWWAWVLAVLVVIGLVIGGFFAFGGDADVDVDRGNVDVESPDVEGDVDAPDVDVNAPDVDVDPGDVDVDGATADAEASNDND